VKENLPVAKLAKSFGGQPIEDPPWWKVSATSATVGMNSSAARLTVREVERRFAD
jgi:hypothetical protein